ncbi:MAG: InlB B-repeat-containing protein [Acholeplasmatales bacterium]|nr:InlB B-repeat-containing protein [Acholeplasmatales bacterium]
MNKFKKILLGTLSVLTLGLFVATGARVNAGTVVTNYEWTPASSYSLATLGSKVKATVSNSFISIDSNATPRVYGGSAPSGSTISNETNKTFGSTDYEIFYSGGRTITVNLSADQTATVDVYIYNNSTSDNNLTIGGQANTVAKVANDVVTISKISGNLDSNHKTIGVVGNQALLYMYFTITTTTVDSNMLSITYDENGGSAVATDQYENAGTVNLAAASTRTGYDFTGWKIGNTTYAAGAQFDLTESVTAVAQWTPKTYTVTYDANGGAVSSATTTVTYDASYNLVVPTYAGKTFVGWFNGSTPVAASGTKWSIASDVTLKAEWLSPISSSYSHNFTDDGKDDNNISISGNLATNKGTATYNNTDLTQCLKMESSTNISFATSKDMTLVLVFASTETGKKVTVDDHLYTTDSNARVTVELEPGAHSIVKGGGDSINLFYIDLTVEEISNSVTATLLKQFDDDDNPTKLRLIGKIQGIAVADYANISNVLMEFDFNGNHKSAYCYKLYKSVSSASLAAGDDVMYVVLTISNVNAYAGQSKSFTNVKMTITYSDNSTTIATRDDIALA